MRVSVSARMWVLHAIVIAAEACVGTVVEKRERSPTGHWQGGKKRGGTPLFLCFLAVEHGFLKAILSYRVVPAPGVGEVLRAAPSPPS